MEAAYALRGPIAAGTWGLIGDGIIAGASVESATVLFEARWRKQGTGDDVVLMSVQNTFTRDITRPFSAVPFSTQVAGIAGGAAGDLLVLRFTALGGDPGAVYILNGDGSTREGSIPRLDLPQN